MDIFYAEHNFIKTLFKKYGFDVGRTYYHENHSVFFEFIRSTETISNLSLINKYSTIDVPFYFHIIFTRIKNIHNTINQYPDRKVYIWFYAHDLSVNTWIRCI